MYEIRGHNDHHYVVDTKADLSLIKAPEMTMGSTAYVIDEAATYMVDSKGV